MTDTLPGMGAKPYGPEIREAAKTLHIEGLNAREIRERLATGTAGLAVPVKPGERTIGLWITAWNREGIRRGFRVRTGDEEAVENAHYRRILALARETADRLDREIGKGTANLDLARQLEVLQKIIETTRAKRKISDIKARGEPLTNPEVGELGDTGGTALGRLVLAEKQREKRETGQTEPPIQKPTPSQEP